MTQAFPLRQFRAIRSFFSTELQSHYVDGLTYTVRPGNGVLATLAMGWEEEGKIQWLKPIPMGGQDASLSGIGNVND